jgi:hypothetical protein
MDQNSPEVYFDIPLVQNRQASLEGYSENTSKEHSIKRPASSLLSQYDIFVYEAYGLRQIKFQQ